MEAHMAQAFRDGLAIPAHPLALTAQRKLDERRQRALSRYYIAAGAGGLAIGVHTTQFAIRDPAVGLFKPVLTLAAEEMDRADGMRPMPLFRIAGICGQTAQAVGEATLARDLRYHAGLLSLAALKGVDEVRLLDHCRAVADTLPVIGFYLQPAAGGRELNYRFWRQFADIPNLIGIKIAPFNRYHTLDVIRAVAESGRTDIALYTGNDDNIVIDLLTPFRFGATTLRIVGGLLGHWSVWTHRSVEIYRRCRRLAVENQPVPPEILMLSAAVTDSNAAFFDAANAFVGCIPGLHEVLRHQGLLEGIWCLNPQETLSAGQADEIARVYREYPQLNDDDFVRTHCQEWLR